MKLHKESKRVTDGDVECTWCGETFGSKSQMYRHRNSSCHKYINSRTAHMAETLRRRSMHTHDSVQVAASTTDNLETETGALGVEVANLADAVATSTLAVKELATKIDVISEKLDGVAGRPTRTNADVARPFQRRSLPFLVNTTANLSIDEM